MADDDDDADEGDPAAEPRKAGGHGLSLKDMLELFLKAPAAALVVVALVVLGWSYFDATHDRDIVVKPLSVPDDFGPKGLGGPVLATRLYGKLLAIQEKTHSDHTGGRLSTALDNPIKVEIPGTGGLSLEDVSQVLHEHFGHRTEIAGAIFSDGTTLNVSARVGGESTPVRPITAMQNIDGALDLLANDITYQVDRYRYAEYIDQIGCHQEALQMAPTLAMAGARGDRDWAHALWSNLLIQDGELVEARSKAQEALKLDPSLEYAYHNLALIDLAEGRLTSASLDAGRQAELIRNAGNISDEAKGLSANIASGNAAAAKASFLAATNAYRSALDHVKDRDDVAVIDLTLATAMVRNHDLSGLDALVGQAAWVAQQDYPDEKTNETSTTLSRLPFSALIYSKWYWPFLPPDLAAALELEDWDDLLQLALLYRSQEPRPQPNAPPQKYFAGYDAVFIQPLVALAQAHTGHAAEARAWASSATPDGCEACRLWRGRVFAAIGDAAAKAAADRIFRDLEAGSPTLPQAHFERAKLLRGHDDEGALREASLAHTRAPGWADPLVLYAEIAFDKHDPTSAAEAIGQAAILAPNWAHLQEVRAKVLARLNPPLAAQASAAARSAQALNKDAGASLKTRLQQTAASIKADPKSAIDDPGSEDSAACQAARTVVGG